MCDIDNFALPVKPFVKPTDKEMYAHMYEQGKRRFGSECQHVVAISGHSQRCLRKVISKF